MEQRISTYEGLFLFPMSAAVDMQSAVDHVTGILERRGAEIISLSKWDERRLAYDIKGNKRGLYFIVYFKSERSAITTIERDCNLSEHLLRAMMTRADHVTDEEITGAEGREQLADEIKLRGQQTERADTNRSAVVTAEAVAAEAAAATAKAAAEAAEAEAEEVEKEKAEEAAEAAAERRSED